MAELNRDDLIATLDRLAAGSDEEVLTAARELHRQVSGSGLDWDDILRADLGRPEEDQAEPDNAAAEEDIAAAPSAPAAAGEDGRLIDRIAARENLSEDLRGEIELLRRDLAEGEFSEMDRSYVRSLAERLGVKPGG